MNDPPLQRVAGLSGAPDLLRELGADPRDACAGLSFSPDELVPDAMIPFGEALQLLDNCARITGHAQFGLILGSRHNHMSLGPIGQLMQVARNLGDAIGEYIRAQIGLSRGAAIYSIPFGNDIALGFGIYARHQPGVGQAYDFAMAVGVNLARTLTGGRASIQEVLLCHRPPADPAVFEHVLKTKVRFNQYQSCLILPRADLSLPNPAADSARHEVLAARIAAMMRLDTIDPAVLLHHRMKPLLMQGEYSLAAVARHLEMHPRTLNRRLIAGGSSFVEVRDRIRLGLAQELLALTDLPVGDIAAALSFSEHGNFGRAFRRWTAMTPTEWRLQASPPPAPPPPRPAPQP